MDLQPMTQNYVEELVYTQTEDNVKLEGATICPASAESKPLGIIWHHGLASRFSSAVAVQIGRMLATRGYPFLTANNRGHDFGIIMKWVDGKPVMGGGGWELFSESPYDIAAWIDFMLKEMPELRGVVLAGHSLGALKVTYYQAQRQDRRVAGLIAASPPKIASRLQPELRALAERLVAEGRGKDLLPWDISPAGAGTYSAQTYFDRTKVNLDIFGFQTPDPVAAAIHCPLFAFYGTDEAWIGSAAELETIRRNITAPVATRMIEGADHSYAGYEREVATAIGDWVGTLL